MYWVDWGSSRRGVIERASMDGTSRSIVHNISVASPVSLALDPVTQTLYWIDDGRIESSSVDGSNRRMLLFRPSILSDTFGMAVFKGTIYWTERAKRTIYSTSVSNPVNYKAVWQASNYVLNFSGGAYEIAIVSPSEQPACEYSVF